MLSDLHFTSRAVFATSTNLCHKTLLNKLNRDLSKIKQFTCQLHTYSFPKISLFFFQQIPSLAGLLFLLKDFFFIQDLSITELELGFVYANKSSLLARIFTALLLTPHQRKR